MPRESSRKISGILLLDKPVGITSTQALSRAKWILRAQKAGHTGSLDPLASGMLPLCFGEATKLSSYLLDAEKCYLVDAALGVGTNTGDADGEAVSEAPVPKLTEELLKKTLENFRGELEQVPPMYSALKHQGKRLYELARKGITVERKPRKITIYDITLSSLTERNFALRVRCSKGTYVRTLVEDIAKSLGTCGHVSGLRRIGVGGYGESDQMVNLKTLGEDEAPERFLLPSESALRRFPEARLTKESSYFFRHGQAVLVPRSPLRGQLRLYDQVGEFLGIGEVLDDGRIAPKRLISA